MYYVFIYSQIALGLILIIFTLIQQKGSGIGSSFGGDSAMYRTKRGAERLVFKLTVATSILFVLASLGSLIVSR